MTGSMISQAGADRAEAHFELSGAGSLLRKVWASEADKSQLAMRALRGPLPHPPDAAEAHLSREGG